MVSVPGIPGRRPSHSHAEAGRNLQKKNGTTVLESFRGRARTRYSPEMSAPHETLTDLLRDWHGGLREADPDLLARIYAQLHRLAKARLRSERPRLTLATTDLVHEAFLRLAGQRATSWRNRDHFFAVAATSMRRILVDRARRLQADKRRPDAARVELDEVRDVEAVDDVGTLAVDDALRDLERFDPFKARIVELRFFGGFTEAETAAALGCSRDTVTRHWRSARAWLGRRLARSA